MTDIAPRKYFTDHILPCSAKMYAAALAITGSREDASDAVQTAMLKVWERVSAGIYPESPAAYCLSAIRNICITECTRTSRYVAIDETPDVAPDKNGIEEAVELNEVRASLMKLPEKERKAVEMSAYAGSSTDDITKALGVTPVNARQILSRGRRTLRSLFSKK